MPFGLLQHGDLVQPGLRAIGRRGQHPPQPRRDQRGCVLIEQIRGDGHRSPQAARAVPAGYLRHDDSRSNLACARPVGTGVAVTSGRSAARAATVPMFCKVSITWNSGWRASDRSGATTSTSRSNGTS